MFIQDYQAVYRKFWPPAPGQSVLPLSPPHAVSGVLLLPFLNALLLLGQCKASSFTVFDCTALFRAMQLLLRLSFHIKSCNHRLKALYIQNEIEGESPSIPWYHITILFVQQKNLQSWMNLFDREDEGV
ncbi:hypothetical protein J7I80_03170 [Bacillus sp. ISL-41]|uniref:hypothetical protein n=1 Tax=Bacillus sp. ISL-41 TaxID=2819127 RepID=UPI001BE7D3B5|nr:hypothetical protein [Bacillus sp. ISL-41]MBT2641229.1 hypothetical protein [Bacillus sp. ISL-41]